jgi:hypothetical protein
MKRWLTRFRAFLVYSFQGNFYSVRRAAIWPEDLYKRGMLRRVQRVFQTAFFVETGTYRGETCRALQSFFEHLWTIELDPVLYENAKKDLARFPRISCLAGDSKKVLEQIIPSLTKSTLFWLDGHYSGDNTARGEEDSPLLQELRLIAKGPKPQEYVIVIDDMSDCTLASGTPLSKVVAALEAINPAFKFYFDYDMLFALPSEKLHREFWKKIAPAVVIR